MNRKIAVSCPSCYGFVMNVDEKSQINKSAKCRHCKKMVLYKVDTKTTEIVPDAERHCASGIKFM